MVDFDASPQLKAVKRWFDAYASLDINKVEPLIAKNYQYEALPESIGLSKEAKEEHFRRLKKQLSMLSEMEVIYHEVIEAPGKVILHTTRMYSTAGATFPYDTIAIVTLVEEDGELKILHCKDFGDPQKRSACLVGIANAVAEKAAA